MSEPASRLPRPAAALFDLIASDEDARVCKDIPEAACREMPRNFFLTILSNTASKIGDELASAKLVLAWLMAALGAPGFLAGFLVPVRESGSLLPQLFVASHIRRAAIRKWFWVGGSIGQGLAVLGMAVVALTLSGTAAGWALLGLLALFALSRGVSSVASKDVLGKTIAKTRRGTVMGYAAALAGFVTLGVGGWVSLRAESTDSVGFFAVLLIAAGLMWFAAGGIFAAVKEAPGATEGGGNAVSEALRSLGLMKTDPLFRHFVITRALLMSTALAMPFYVILAQQQTGGSLGSLGLMIIATGLAGGLSAPVWGRLSDRSSRLVLVASGVVAGALGLLTFGLSGVEGAWAKSEVLFAALFLVIGIAHSGVRLGRKTYLVDMATQDNRAAYVAVSNTLVGALLLVGGLFGVVADLAGVAATLALLGLMSLLGAVSAWRLEEVQR
ncbi:MFS transporter [Thioalkalivibrio sulfidiphilus]|uniref:MFS transporter n=1 Tax=Thioalkalivibrio sulfidiphilus TaxID=1033854 RepID=UPI0003A54D22|nr:MFS transporter [Thioalkalivibrio sulfidiphilus]